MDNGIKIRDICCGLHHSLAIDFDNKIYGWGDNSYCQCGLVGTTIAVPMMIDAFKDMNVKSMKCGDFHSYVCTMEGDHYLFGCNNEGQCIDVIKNKEVGDNISPYKINDDIDGELYDICLGKSETVLLINKA